jgi:hypothetical protein
VLLQTDGVLGWLPAYLAAHLAPAMIEGKLVAAASVLETPPRMTSSIKIELQVSINSHTEASDVRIVTCQPVGAKASSRLSCRRLKGVMLLRGAKAGSGSSVRRLRGTRRVSRLGVWGRGKSALSGGSVLLHLRLARTPGKHLPLHMW